MLSTHTILQTVGVSYTVSILPIPDTPHPPPYLGEPGHIHANSTSCGPRMHLQDTGWHAAMELGHYIIGLFVETPALRSVQ